METPRRRSEWLVRLALAQADVVAILLAYFIAHALVPDQGERALPARDADPQPAAVWIPLRCTARASTSATTR